MRFRPTLIAIAMASAVLVSQHAEATPIIFTDRAAFEAAVLPNVLVPYDSFEFLPPGDRGIVDGVLLSSTIGTIPANPFGGNLRLYPFNGVQYTLTNGSLFSAF